MQRHRYGIVDVGSNTIRLVVYVQRPGGSFRLLDEVRERARLGEGLAETGELGPAPMKRALRTLGHVADYTRSTRLEGLEVIGTSALRDAVNAEDFLERARDLGLEIRVLPGEEEARLGVLAVANSFALRDAWVMDLGGGSVQISRMEARRMVDGGAHPLGAVRLTEAFLRHDPPKKKEVRALEAAVANELAEVAAEMRRSHDRLLVMGGTVRNLVRAIQKQRGDDLDLLHGAFLPRRQLESLVDDLLAKTTAQRARIPGIHPDRADVITAGALVFRWLLRHGEHEGMTLSGYGVREGAFYRQALPAPHLLPDVARASVDGLTAEHVPDAAHAQTVRKLARRLFDQLRDVHLLEPRNADLLDAAAALHEVGQSVHYYRHQKHAFHILGAGPLDGFDHREQAMVMLLVRYQKKNTPKLSPLKGLMKKGDKRRLLMLSGLLRLADALDRTRAGRVRELGATATGDAVRITVDVDDPCAVEVLGARQLADYVERVFRRRLVVEAK